MRAIVFDQYGPPEVLRLEHVADPVPKPDELLIAIHASTVNRLDCATRDANRSNGAAAQMISRLAFGIRGPRRHILGNEFAGEVRAVGPDVREFAPGDVVFGVTGLRFGAHAELLCVKEHSRVARKPAAIDIDEAAAICDGALNALGCLRSAGVEPGQHVLVYGASGAIGTAGVQIARHMGADVTAVCSTKNLDLVRSLGARAVIDYTRQDFTRNGERYDVIFDAVGKHSFSLCKGSLKPNGFYLATDGFRNLALAMWNPLRGGRKVVFLPPGSTRRDVHHLGELVDAGAFKPVIDRRYAMEEVVEAVRYVETEQKTGNVLLDIAGRLR